MYPILFQVGPITVYTAGVVLFIGFLISLFLARKLTDRAGLRMAFIFDYLFSLLIVAFAAGRLTFVFSKWELYRHQLTDVLKVWDGGFTLSGAVIIAIFYFFYLCLRHQQRFLMWMDALVLPLAAMYGFSYIALAMSEAGISAQGVGTPTSLPWGVIVDLESSPYAGTPVHPVALYMAFLCGCIVLILGLCKKKMPTLAPGVIFFAATMLFMVSYILVELLKWEITPMIFGYNARSVSASVLALASLGGIIFAVRKHKRQTAASLSPH